MATQDLHLGTIVMLFLNGKRVANAKTHSIKFSADMIEVTNKDSAGFKEYLPGEIGGTLSCEAFMENDPSVSNDKYSFQDLWTAMAARTNLACRLTTNVAGDDAFECTGFIKDLSKDDPNNDASAISFEIQLTSTITRVTES
jgi:TP901-1 family phage major tail protein